MGDTIIGVHRENDTNVGHGIQDEVRRADEERLEWCREQSRPKTDAPIEFKLPDTPHIAQPENLAFDQEQLEHLQRLGVHARLATPEEQREALEEEAERRMLTQVFDPLGATAVYAAPFESSPGYPTDQLTITDGTGPLLHLHNSHEVSKDELLGRLSVVLGMPLEELEDRIEGRRRDPRQQELFDPDVETVPHPDAPDRVNRTVNKTNLPGGFLMNTRSFEKWVLESFVPLQDKIAAVEEKMDYAINLLKEAKVEDKAQDNTLLKSRLGRLEQLVREIKSGK